MKNKLGWIIAAILAVVLLVMIFLPVAYGRRPGDLYGSQAAQLSPPANFPQPQAGLAPGCECGRGGTGRWDGQQNGPPPPQGGQSQRNWPGQPGQKDWHGQDGAPQPGAPGRRGGGQPDQGKWDRQGRGFPPQQGGWPGQEDRFGRGDRPRPGDPMQPYRVFPGSWLLFGALRLLLVLGLMALAVLGVVFIARRWSSNNQPVAVATPARPLPGIDQPPAAQDEPAIPAEPVEPAPPAGELDLAPGPDEPVPPAADPDAQDGRV